VREGLAPEYKIRHAEAQNRLLALVLIECIQQRERLIAFLAERPHGFPVQRIERGLSSGKCWGKNPTLARSRFFFSRDSHSCGGAPKVRMSMWLLAASSPDRKPRYSSLSRVIGRSRIRFPVA
jgi:hypothetical protein